MQTMKIENRTEEYRLGEFFLTGVLVGFNKIAFTIAIISMTKKFNVFPYQIGLLMSSFFFSNAAIADSVTNKAINKSIMMKIMVLWTGLAVATANARYFICLMVLRSMHATPDFGIFSFL
jgi:hypothetical protein